MSQGASPNAVEEGIPGIPSEGGLIARELIRLEYLPVPDELSDFVAKFYLFRCDECEIRDIQPAGVGQMMIFLRGHGAITFRSGQSDSSTGQNLLTPQTRASAVTVEGPLHVFGVIFAPLGWAALTGLDARKWGNRLLDAADLFGKSAVELGDAIRAAYSSDPEMSGAELVELATPFLVERIKPVDPGHKRLLGNVAAWLGTSLNPPVQELYERCIYSPRQVQRLVARFFGSSPTHLARQYRAIRVAALLGQRDIDDAQVAALLNQFYDQSHMIREIREFVGRTPSRLGAGNAPIFDSYMSMRNYREIEPRVAALPKEFNPLEKGESAD